MSSGSLDWLKLLEGQRILEEGIAEVRGLDFKKKYKEERLLATIIELAELINSSKVFKYWSIKEGDKAQILDEYADVLHFVLSICIDQRIDPSDICVPEGLQKKDRKELTSLFSDLIFGFKTAYDGDTFKEWIRKFINMSAYLGFDTGEIEDAYWKKRQVNFERLNNKSY